MMVKRIEQFGVSPSCSSLREHSVCTNSVSNFRYFLVDAHISALSVVTGTVHPAVSADSQEICRSVMENSEPSTSKSDLGLGSSTQLVSSASLAQTGGHITRACWKTLV